MALETQIVDIQIPNEEVTEIKDSVRDMRAPKENKVFRAVFSRRVKGADHDPWSFVRNTPGMEFRFALNNGKPSHV